MATALATTISGSAAAQSSAPKIFKSQCGEHCPQLLDSRENVSGQAEGNAPQWFRMRHYLFLSVPHAVRKYVEKRFDPAEVEAGWHDLRDRLCPEMIKLPAEAELRRYRSDDEFDPSNPRVEHYLFDAVWAARQERG
jgi:hypothetical protein